MNHEDQQVSTEAQRQALEAMSAELIGKLNAMIREQEERVRVFAEQHSTTITTPHPTPGSGLAMGPTPTRSRGQQAPPPTSNTPDRAIPAASGTSVPRQHAWKNKVQPPPQQEESNIGMGMVIFSLIGIILLIRSCT